MTDIKYDLETIKGLIWKARALMGQDQFDASGDHIISAAKLANTVTVCFVSRIPFEQLVELKELTEQCVSILRYLDEKQSAT